MQASPFQIDFLKTNGRTLRLLDAGDRVAAPLEFAAGQEAAPHAAAGAVWGKADSRGKIRRTLEWTRTLEHASHAAAEAYCLHHAAEWPVADYGTLRITIPGGQTWDLHDAVVTGLVCRRDASGTFATAATYRLEAGIPLPVANLPFFCGIPHRWELYSHEHLTINHDGSLPAGILPLPPLRHRVTDDGNEKWWEVGFNSCELLVGSAATGWTDANQFIRLDLQRSEDLVNWTHGEYIDCAATAIPMGDGTYDYWARSVFPVDSKVKTGQLWCESPSAGYGTFDVRNNPFTGLTVNNVVRALGGFPYTMPGDAARMQADMIANGLTGATVVATTATNWRIDIPNVYQTAYAALTKVFWPVYYVADMFGVVNVPVDGMGFTGRFINSAGVRTNVQKQFSRLRYTIQP